MAEAAPSTPASALLRVVPLSLWPEAVRDRRRRLAAGLRRLEDLRAELVDKLDALTPDPDLEPSLAAAEYRAHTGRGLPADIARELTAWSKGVSDDREADVSATHTTSSGEADEEPDLGSPESKLNGGGGDQRRWARGRDGEADSADDEPWLGSLTTPCTMTVHREAGGRRAVGVTVHRDDQRGWGLSSHTDAEEQCEDEGEPEWA